MRHPPGRRRHRQPPNQSSRGHAWNGRGLSKPARAVQTLRRAVIEAKEPLFVPSTTIEVEYGGRSYRRELTSELFDRLLSDHRPHLGPCRNAWPTPLDACGHRRSGMVAAPAYSAGRSRLERCSRQGAH